jgi:hypothetical protein
LASQNNITDQKISNLVELGRYFRNLEKPEIQQCFHEASIRNPWFTAKQISLAVHQVVENYLQAERLHKWLEAYDLNYDKQKEVALVLAGNIPMVGIHDIICGYVANHRLQIKLSEKDSVLIPFITKILTNFDQTLAAQINFVERIQNFDAVIATGSNRSGVFFESYFKKYPHIIRKNRSAVAVLAGTETKEDLQGLAQDIFAYFGLGCRNISKIYLPEDYNLELLLEFLHGYNEIVLHHKYKNNFDYNYALFMLNKDKFYINGALLLKEDSRIASRIASVHYEKYKSRTDLIRHLKQHDDEIQCICTLLDLSPIKTIPFGTCQKPQLNQYADGVDTMKFLTSL